MSYSAKGVPGPHARARKWQARGVPADCLDAEALQSRMGTTAFAGGWRDGRAGGIQPLSYLRGLAWPGRLRRRARACTSAARSLASILGMDAGRPAWRTVPRSAPSRW